MVQNERRYLSYLLRLWRVKRNGDVTWRASLEDSRTGERRCFASLEELVNFLGKQVGNVGVKEDGSITSE